MEKLRVATQNEGENHVHLVTPEGMNRDEVGKVAEYVSTPNEKRPTNKKPKAKPKRKTVMIQSEGKTYAKVLKTSKEGVDIKQIGVEIMGIRKIRDNAIRLQWKRAGR
ncbi:hypothetical protein JTB14_009779 [Gonioctena quinquepunctata]|nr:hypothetical protein JTB14_009779 [Gonioctena quinquepunctata]